jgi:hypothetical protein
MPIKAYRNIGISLNEKKELFAILMSKRQKN